MARGPQNSDRNHRVRLTVLRLAVLRLTVLRLTVLPHTLCCLTHNAGFHTVGADTATGTLGGAS